MWSPRMKSILDIVFMARDTRSQNNQAVGRSILMSALSVATNVFDSQSGICCNMPPALDKNLTSDAIQDILDEPDAVQPQLIHVTETGFDYYCYPATAIESDKAHLHKCSVPSKPKY